jgi:glycosyltransferase involved in cell wall biosynthesis
VKFVGIFNIMFKKPFSLINLVPDKTGWSTHWEYKELYNILNSMEFEVLSKKTSLFQVCHLPDKYLAINKSRYHILGNRVSFDYYHGDPRISPEFMPLIKRLKKRKRHFDRIRVSHSGIEDLLANEGFEDKVFRIPIGINLDFFSAQSEEKKQSIRRKLGIPKSAFVIGSFQKDGNGWNAGNHPKLIKGPDIFINTVSILKHKIPELFVLLTGPARGYIKKELKRLKIPYKHYFLENYNEVGKYFHALDVYLVTSREEGGPKGVLESMASGVPIVSTKVGQAQDIIQHGVNGWLSECHDYEEIANSVMNIFEHTTGLLPIVESALLTAEENQYNRQHDLWRRFFEPMLL